MNISLKERYMTENKKGRIIALVANTTWNIYNFRLNLIEKFLSAGFKVIVVAPVDEYLIYKDKYPSVLHYNLQRLVRDGVNPLNDIRLFLELRRIYKEINPDVILHFTNKPNIYGSLAAKSLQLKSIAIITGLGYPFIHGGLLKRIVTSLYKISGRFNEKFIFENIEDRELFESLTIVTKQKSISIKGCGVNTQWYKPMENTKKRKKTVFTFIGRLLYDKGIREFVEAAKIVGKNRNDVEFLIVGEIDENNPATIDKKELIQWIEDEIIQYLGFVKDIREVIASSDCIVLPSYREAIARTITEGMAMGKPIITSQTAGCREAVQDGENGYLVEIKNSKALADTFLKFMSLLPEEKKLMGEIGRMKACNEFDDAIIADQINDIVYEVLK
jgi:glycosyltransferase involved in cell wall biosynthesis